MSVFMRIDDRFIHGQVGVTWISYVGAEEVVLVNDDLFNDSLASMMQKMTLPTMKVTIKNLIDGSNYLNKVQSLRKLFVIVANPQDALYLVNNNLELKTINIGHSAHKEDSKEIYPYLFVGEKELQAYKDLELLGIDLDFRLVPDHKRTHVEFSTKIFEKI
ncbi:MAG: PTS sugar transporter subunit IIB [Bacillota bacterium]|jgi:mannose/fructose/N-acetylgalactosamine-specific phosphotransferase system component IIB|nr:PTS sugar transporter subunit IIB [Bacillota bacterium]NLP22586.1 PTS sugar transporter subunit IIB [Erysipelotrichaceae bacterium]